MGERISRLLQESNRDNQIENKASPARLMGVKQNQKQSHRLHQPQSGRLHVDAMSLTSDEESSSPMSFLGKERQRETLHGRKEYRLPVLLFNFFFHLDALSLNGSIMIINQSINHMPGKMFCFWIISQFLCVVWYTHTLYPGTLQYITNWSDISWFLLVFEWVDTCLVIGQVQLVKKNTPQPWRPPMPCGRHGALSPAPPHTTISQHDA